MKRKTYLVHALSLACILALPSGLAAQVQTIRGTVVDKDTRQPLTGATVFLPDLETTLGAVTEYDGTFVLEKVPVGRHTLVCRYIGYSAWQGDGLVLTAARELVLDIELKEDAATLGEVLVTAVVSPHSPLNDAALLSARSFSVEEVQHFAGAINDPGRMAHSLPGVQPSRDNEGDIIIRGNASTGVLWRLEGVDILNPNHFARLGGSGGGLTIFSVSVLSTSDFFAGAFPAEYGNALAGVFDLRFRNGNRDTRQHRFRAGMLGLEYGTEGPFSTKQGEVGKSGSYLFNYRYSTLGILNEMGVYLVGERVRNNFQDLSFNLFFPGKDGRSSLRVWGVGGLSTEDKLAAQQPWQIFDDSLSYENGSRVGVVGLTHTVATGEKSHLKTTVAAMGQKAFHHERRNLTTGPQLILNDEDYQQGRVALSTFYTWKISPQSTFKTGLQLSQLFYDLTYDSIQATGQVANFVAEKGSILQAQPFAQLGLQPNANWTVNLGVHGMYFGLTESVSVEPRLSARRRLGSKQSISVAAGYHSQAVPLGVYFARVETNGETDQPNRNLPLMKSLHYVVAYDAWVAPQLRLHVEGYRQDLFDIPGDRGQSYFFWLLNEMEGYPNRHFGDAGKGTNTGLDIALEKSFRQGFFFLLTGSVFNSTYRFAGTRDFNTQFNANYSGALTMAREWSFSQGGIWQVGVKNLWMNGLPTTPLAAEQLDGESPILDESRPFGERVRDYFRSDLRLAWRKSRHSLSLDVQNVFNIENLRPFERIFDPIAYRWVHRPQAGITPVLSWQVDW
jgi:hypothetical protein